MNDLFKYGFKGVAIRKLDIISENIRSSCFQHATHCVVISAFQRKPTKFETGRGESPLARCTNRAFKCALTEWSAWWLRGGDRALRRWWPLSGRYIYATDPLGVAQQIKKERAVPWVCDKLFVIPRKRWKQSYFLVPQQNNRMRQVKGELVVDDFWGNVDSWW